MDMQSKVDPRENSTILTYCHHSFDVFGVVLFISGLFDVHNTNIKLDLLTMQYLIASLF